MVAYSFQKRFIEPILAGLGEGVEAYPKTQTIRNVGRRRHARVGEVVQLYTGMRTRQCRKLGVARCRAVLPVRLYLGPSSLGVDLDGRYFCGETETQEFARSDGFANVEEMLRFWLVAHPGVREFGGFLIQWERIGA